MEYITKHEFTTVARSKREAYDKLTGKGKCYLPPLEQVNADYIADVLCGNVEVVHNPELNPIKVPHIDGLRVRDIIMFARDHFDIDRYLPNLKKGATIDRTWVCNIIHSIIPGEFEAFIDKRMEVREQKYIEKKSIHVPALPKFAFLFKDASVVSRQNGKFHNMVRTSKQRRIKKETKAKEPKEDKHKDDIIKDQSDHIYELEEKLKDFQRVQESYDMHVERLSRLYDMGIINSEGELISKDHNNEQ